jgi:hypothetical protein
MVAIPNGATILCYLVVTKQFSFLIYALLTLSVSYNASTLLFHLYSLLGCPHQLFPTFCFRRAMHSSSCVSLLFFFFFDLEVNSMGIVSYILLYKEH